MSTDHIHVILDAADSRECARKVGALHDLDHGRVVVRPTPPITTQSLAHDLLRALGKRLEFPESPPQAAAVELASLWLAAEAVDHVYVLRAHLLDAATVQMLLSVVSAGTDVSFMAAAEQTPAAIGAALAASADSEGGQDLRPALRPTASPGTPQPALGFDVRTSHELGDLGQVPKPRAAPAEPWPAVPEADEFFAFRSAARALLPDAAFARIDEELDIGWAAAREWIGLRGRRLRARFRKDEIEAFLSGLLAPATTRQQALARIRGAQVAFFVGGTLVELPADALHMARTDGFAALDPGTIQLLRGFAAPALAAAGTLALASQVSPRYLCKLLLGDVGRDGAHAVFNNKRFPIPEPARGLVRAQWLARERTGAHDCDPLFIDRASTAISPQRMTGMLLRVSHRTGLSLLPDRLTTDKQSGPVPWLNDAALSVTSLESLGQRELYV